MPWAVFLLLILSVVSSCVPSCFGQPLRVFSEFARIDPAGNVTAPAEPREILSPAIARNAFASFQVVVQVPKDTRYEFHVGLNPEKAVRVTMYREIGGDRLQPVELPVQGSGTQVFWMDLWAERDAIVRRIKVEPQLNVDDDWVIYPMEVRVVDAVVPEGRRPEGAAAPVAVMKNFLCGGRLDQPRVAAPSIPGLKFRNAQQDTALAAKAPRANLQGLFGACDAPAPPDPEWYLKIRDYLFRLR